MTALRCLLAEFIDYAGLFPPAALGMDAAIRNYSSYVNGEHAWALGRFIVPAARLAEYRGALEASGLDAHVWRLSVLATAADADAIELFSRQFPQAGVIDVLEIKAASAREIQDTALVYAGRYRLYFETPPEKWASLLPATAVARARAKLRTGGEVESAIPAASSVLHFLRIASERRLAFKATAGLHHPLRSMQPLTYQRDSPRAVMHGFLNLFCAATLLWHEPRMGQEAAWMLAEQEPAAVTMDDDTMTWHNSGVVLTSQQIREAREHFAISFGSCSFDEPMEDLKAYAWL